MDNYLSSEIIQLEKELTRLKTSMSKSAGVIQTVAQTVNVSIPLALNPSMTTATGEKEYIVIPEQDAIMMCTLNWYSGDVAHDHLVPREVRKVYITETEDAGKRRMLVSAVGTQWGSGNDVDRLIGGESVSITCKLTVRATCNFTIQEANA